MSRGPRILMLSDTERLGGAGLAASRLARAFAEQGSEVVRAVLFPDQEPSPHWERVVLSPPGVRVVDWDQVPNRKAEPLVLAELQRLLDRVRPDAVSVHNLHGGLKAGWSVDMVGLCAAQVSTIWTMHDMWSFTGKCIYAGDCLGYQGDCGPGCSDLDRYPFWDREALAEEFARKRRVLAEHARLAAVSPSHWLAGLARKGLWGPRRVEVISNCLDLDIYLPQPAQQARNMLGLEDPSGPVLLACAADFQDPRKGAALLAETLRALSQRPATLLLMGRNPVIDAPKGIDVVSLGFVQDRDVKAAAYAAADVFVHAALEDNLPNTVAEALACGTPVAAFASGGVPEMVRHGENGFLAHAFTGVALAEAVGQALEGQQQLRLTAREIAMEMFDPARCAGVYLRIAGCA